jgi:hypothetical protein
MAGRRRGGERKELGRQWGRDKEGRGEGEEISAENVAERFR